MKRKKVLRTPLFILPKARWRLKMLNISFWRPISTKSCTMNAMTGEKPRMYKCLEGTFPTLWAHFSHTTHFGWKSGLLTNKPHFWAEMEKNKRKIIFEITCVQLILLYHDFIDCEINGRGAYFRPECLDSFSLWCQLKHLGIFCHGGILISKLHEFSVDCILS